jgi:hypothetical protein
VPHAPPPRVLRRSSGAACGHRTPAHGGRATFPTTSPRMVCLISAARASRAARRCRKTADTSSPRVHRSTAAGSACTARAISSRSRPSTRPADSIPGSSFTSATGGAGKHRDVQSRLRSHPAMRLATLPRPTARAPRPWRKVRRAGGRTAAPNTESAGSPEHGEAGPPAALYGGGRRLRRTTVASDGSSSVVLLTKMLPSRASRAHPLPAWFGPGRSHPGACAHRALDPVRGAIPRGHPGRETPPRGAAPVRHAGRVG